MQLGVALKKYGIRVGLAGTEEERDEAYHGVLKYIIRKYGYDIHSDTDGGEEIDTDGGEERPGAAVPVTKER